MKKENIQIREMKERDIPEASKIVVEMWYGHTENSEIIDMGYIKKMDIEKYLKDCMDDKNQLVLVAINNKEMIGTIRGEIIKNKPWFVEKNQLYMDELVVKEAYKKQGVATALINKLAEFAEDKDIKLLTARVYDFNIPSQGLLKKLGFKVDYLFFEKQEKR